MSIKVNYKYHKFVIIFIYFIIFYILMILSIFSVKTNEVDPSVFSNVPIIFWLGFIGSIVSLLILIRGGSKYAIVSIFLLAYLFRILPMLKYTLPNVADVFKYSSFADQALLDYRLDFYRSIPGYYTLLSILHLVSNTNPILIEWWITPLLSSIVVLSSYEIGKVIFRTRTEALYLSLLLSLASALIYGGYLGVPESIGIFLYSLLLYIFLKIYTINTTNLRRIYLLVYILCVGGLILVHDWSMIIFMLTLYPLIILQKDSAFGNQKLFTFSILTITTIVPFLVWEYINSLSFGILFILPFIFIVTFLVFLNFSFAFTHNKISNFLDLFIQKFSIVLSHFKSKRYIGAITIAYFSSFIFCHALFYNIFYYAGFFKGNLLVDIIIWSSLLIYGYFFILALIRSNLQEYKLLLSAIVVCVLLIAVITLIFMRLVYDLPTIFPARLYPFIIFFIVIGGVSQITHIENKKIRVAIVVVIILFNLISAYPQFYLQRNSAVASDAEYLGGCWFKAEASSSEVVTDNRIGSFFTPFCGQHCSILINNDSLYPFSKKYFLLSDNMWKYGVAYSDILPPAPLNNKFRKIDNSEYFDKVYVNKELSVFWHR